MTKSLTAQSLLEACSDLGFDSGIRIESELEPQAGPGTPVKPAVYDGGRYQQDKRWASPSATEATEVIVIDNVPSQANRLELALERGPIAMPQMILDLSSLPHLPVHLPRRLSSLQFAHRNADAYLRDSKIGGVDFQKTEIGKSIFDATPWAAGPLMAWFPQALLYGFWQSHLGKKRQQTKHARAWVSEIIGWQPATKETKTMGLKGDALNLTKDVQITSNENDRFEWEEGKVKLKDGKTDKLSETGHGQVPFMSTDLAAAAVSFVRLTQTATVSFSQLRRVGLGGAPEADAAARALLVAMGIYADVFAFGRPFSLRSGADLRPVSRKVTWLGATGADDEDVNSLSGPAVQDLLETTVDQARQHGVPLDGWDTAAPIVLEPKDNLAKAIAATWPELDDE